jgi:hypothetical protein
MSNLEKRKSTDPTTEQSNFFEAYGNAATARSIEGTLLKFSKGDFFAGQQDEEIPLGTRFVAIMDSLLVGWVCWQGNAPIEQRMGLVSDAYQPERRNDLGDLDQEKWERDGENKARDPWQFSNYLILRRAKDGEIFTFATSSRGGLGAIGELAKAYGKAMRQQPDQYPVIELGVDSYQHRDRSLGRIKIPTFRIVGWTTKDGDGNAPASEPSKPLPPKQTTKAAAKKSAAAQPQF